MLIFSDLASVPAGPQAPFTDRLRLLMAAFLTRFKGSSREHAESGLHGYLAWCAERAWTRWPHSSLGSSARHPEPGSADARLVTI